MARYSSLRASDADRERVAERLRHAAGEGRLLAEELEQRLAAALRARTYGDLDAVVADLPDTRVGRRRSSSRALLLRPALALAVVVAVSLAIVVAVLVLTGVLAAWGLWILAAWWIFGGHCGRGRYGRRALRRGRQWQVSGRPQRRAWL
jgi:hypothetical protein